MQDRTNGFFIACFERGGSDPPTRDRTVENRNIEENKSNRRDHRVKTKGRMKNGTDTGLVSKRGIDSKKTKNQKAKKSVEGNNRQPNNGTISLKEMHKRRKMMFYYRKRKRQRKGKRLK